jgi:predicted DNA-binding protein with PD1-like motif
MKHVRLTSDGATFVLVFAPGDEVVNAIAAFAREEGVRAARLTGIGGFSKATLGYFRREAHRYEHISIEEQVELVSLVGDIAIKDDAPLLHAHAAVGHADGHVSGGHLISATVWPTLELFVDVYPLELIKRDQPDLGIATIELP